MRPGTLLDEEDEQQFLELYGHLLVYVNNRFGIDDGIDTYETLEQQDTGELLPIRNHLYEEDTEQLIQEFIDENPADLSADELSLVEAWTDCQFGEFVVVRHFDDHAVFLDWGDPPQAFGVKAVRAPFAAFWDEDALPLLVRIVALLPFKGMIVSDGWFAVQQLVFGGSISTDIDDTYEEAKHRFGLIESLPPPAEETKSDAEQLRFYMKNKRNRDRYHEEIEQLKDKTDELARIYHEERGKSRARSLGRELRELDLNEAYFALYDDRIIASGTSEDQVREILAFGSLILTRRTSRSTMTASSPAEHPKTKSGRYSPRSCQLGKQTIPTCTTSTHRSER